MIETVKMKTKRSIINQQLLSEAYLRELISGKFPQDREWREAYPDLKDENHLRQYVGQCLRALCVSYPLQQNLSVLYSDETKTGQAGICLMVNDRDLGSTIKGSHHQMNLIKHTSNAALIHLLHRLLPILVFHYKGETVWLN